MNFALRRRQNLRAALRWDATLVAGGAALVAITVAPLLLGWWDSAWPAAIASAILALLLFVVAVHTPFEAVAYVDIYTDREPYNLPPPPKGFGRALYRHAGKLEALSRFESEDPLQTKAAPAWHDPRDALPVVHGLLQDADPALRPHLEYLRAALETVRSRDAKFYLMVKTWGGATNARVEALRHGDMSVIARR